jgi:DUF1707 SHOCT-like domain
MSGQQPPGPRFRTWSDLSGRAQLRIGDAEREAAVTALGEHYATGRLSKEEYDERATVAYEARTLAALHPLFADLPLPHGPLQPAAPSFRAGPGPRAPRPRRFPWFPVIVLALVLAIVTSKFFLFWLVILGAWFFAKSRRAHGREHGEAHTSGSCFGGRGSWR